MRGGGGGGAVACARGAGDRGACGACHQAGLLACGAARCAQERRLRVLLGIGQYKGAAAMMQTAVNLALSRLPA